MPAATKIDPVDRLAAVEAYLRAGGYSREADALVAMRDGELTFEAALGLIAHGAKSWRQRTRDARRNQAYLALGELIACGQSPRRKGIDVEGSVGRYEMDVWPRDRHISRAALPENDPQRLLKFDILSSGARLLGKRALRQLFEIQEK